MSNQFLLRYSMISFGYNHRCCWMSIYSIFSSACCCWWTTYRLNSEIHREKEIFTKTMFSCCWIVWRRMVKEISYFITHSLFFSAWNYEIYFQIQIDKHYLRTKVYWLVLSNDLQIKQWNPQRKRNIYGEICQNDVFLLLMNHLNVERNLVLCHAFFLFGWLKFQSLNFKDNRK